MPAVLVKPMKNHFHVLPSGVELILGCNGADSASTRILATVPAPIHRRQRQPSVCHAAVLETN